MRTASAPYPRDRWVAALTLVMILSSAITIKDDAAAKLPPATAQSRGANTRSRLAAVVNDMSRRATQVSQARLLEAYGKLPLSFEINQGQMDPRVKFLSRGSGYSLFLTSNEAVLTLHKGSPRLRVASRHAGRRLLISRVQGATFRPAPAEQHGPETTAAVLRMRLVGANARARVTGLEELPGKSNYFIGNDPRKWRTNVPNYARVKYANVYPGVDLVYYGNQRQLEYDFVVQTGADPRQIGLAVKSQDANNRQPALRTDSNGDLVVRTDAGEVRFQKPIVYQPAIDDGALGKGTARRARHLVDGRYFLNGDCVTFEVAGYDRTRPLVIDPTLAYSTFLGGSRPDFGAGITVNAAGNAYVTGSTFSVDFPTTAGAFQTNMKGDVDAFVSKLNAAGSALVYSTYLGGPATHGTDIAVDTSGNTFVTGYTASSTFPTTPRAFQTTIGGAGYYDVFVSKLNATGSALAHSTYLGGSFNDVGFGIAVDSSGNAYVTGYTGTYTSSSNFPTTSDAFQTTFGGRFTSGYGDAFVSKLNAAGSALIYSTFLGGPDDDFGNGITLDAFGNAYVTGSTGRFFPTTPGAFQPTDPAGAGLCYNGGAPCSEAFVSKLNAAGSALVYSSYLGGSKPGSGASVAVDRSGNAYVTGGTDSADFPITAGAFQTTFGGSGLQGIGDGFVSKLNAAGSALVYSTFLGGSGDDSGTRIGVDTFNNAYVTGATYSRDFPLPQMRWYRTIVRVVAIVPPFLAIDTTGSALLYSTYLGGSVDAYGNSLVVDMSGHAYLTGSTQSTDFPITPGAFQTTLARGDFDAYITKFNFATGVPFSICRQSDD